MEKAKDWGDAAKNAHSTLECREAGPTNIFIKFSRQYRSVGSGLYALTDEWNLCLCRMIILFRKIAHTTYDPEVTTNHPLPEIIARETCVHLLKCWEIMMFITFILL